MNIIAWIVFLCAILSAVLNVYKMLTSKEALERIVTFFIGIPIPILTMTLAYYVLFIK